MNKNSLLRILPIVGALVALTISSVSAQTISITATAVGASGSVGASATVGGTGVSANAKLSASARASLRLANAEKTAASRADQEISRRLTALNALSTRVNAMVKLSSTDKTSLSAQIQTQIAAMNTLRAQIATDASDNATTSLKSDIQSIAKSYRIFALVIPQGAIEAMADRALMIASDIDIVAAKLQARISASSTSANASVAAELADLNAKTTAANTQVQAAVALVTPLQQDNGIQTVMRSNTAALKAAHTDLQTAQHDLVAARNDAELIIRTLEGLSSSRTTINVTATSS